MFALLFSFFNLNIHKTYFNHHHPGFFPRPSEDGETTGEKTGKRRTAQQKTGTRMMRRTSHSFFLPTHPLSHTQSPSFSFTCANGLNCNVLRCSSLLCSIFTFHLLFYFLHITTQLFLFSLLICPTHPHHQSVLQVNCPRSRPQGTRGAAAVSGWVGQSSPRKKSTGRMAGHLTRRQQNRMGRARVTN
jgi:hypothetical protein